MAEARQDRKMELEYPAEPWVVHDIRETVETFLRPSRLGEEDVEALKVALSEAASNAVCHGSPRGRSNRVRIVCTADEERVSLEVFDQGGGFQLREIALPASEEYKPSGRGLFLMRELMDEVLFAPGAEGTYVRLVKRLRPAPVEGPAV